MMLKKIQNRFFHRFLGPLFFQSSQDFYDRPSFLKKLRRDFNQGLNEKGLQTPLIFTPQECAAFWAGVDNNSLSTGNRPNNYAQKTNEILKFLNHFWTPEIPKSSSVLELGCNCGANLYWLHQFGFKDVRGIEINSNAIEHLKASFPEFAGSVKVQQGDIAELLPKMPSGSVDLIFTMGVSMHIHPKNDFIFKEMARVSRRFICTIEPEASNSNYVFARNYRRIFQRLGVHQLKSALIHGKAFAHISDYAGLTARLFTV